MLLAYIEIEVTKPEATTYNVTMLAIVNNFIIIINIFYQNFVYNVLIFFFLSKINNIID